MFQKTITYTDLKHCDFLFYRPRNFFGYLIGIFTAIMNKKFGGVTFSHVAIMLEDNKHPWALARFDALEGKKTGFRNVIGKAYVFRFKNITEEQRNRIHDYCMSRMWSSYDRRGIIAFILRFFGLISEDEFKDYCSELIKNALVYAWMIEDVERITPFDLYQENREKMDFIWLIL